MLAGARRERRVSWTAWFGVISWKSFLWHELGEKTMKKGGLSGSVVP